MGEDLPLPALLIGALDRGVPQGEFLVELRGDDGPFGFGVAGDHEGEQVVLLG